MRFRTSAVMAAIAVLSLAACGGGGGSGTSVPAGTPTLTPTQAPTQAPTTPPTAAPQVIKVALPVGTMGQVNDPTFGVVGGFTQNTSSQALAFAPGAQVMIQNVAPASGGTPHTFNVIGTTGFGASAGGFSAAGGSSIAPGFQSGNIAPQQTIGPFTLSAGTYYIACAYHYTSNQMRDGLTVAVGAAPGPQATPQPAPPAGGNNTPQPCPNGYC